MRAVYESFERRDMEGAFDGLVTPKFELRLPEDYPEGGEVFRGPEGMRRWSAMIEDVWEQWSFEPERLIEAGELVVALTRIRARGGASGVSLDREVAHVWSFEGSLASSVRVYLDREEALAACGLQA